MQGGNILKDMTDGVLQCLTCDTTRQDGSSCNTHVQRNTTGGIVLHDTTGRIVLQYLT